MVDIATPETLWSLYQFLLKLFLYTTVVRSRWFESAIRCRA